MNFVLRSGTKNKNNASNFNRKTKKKLSYKLKRDLHMMPAKITELENRLKQIEKNLILLTGKDARKKFHKFLENKISLL